MTKKTVLIEAIKRLELINQRLRQKIADGKNSEITKSYKQQITRNEAMILDYKFRIQYE